MAAFYPSPFSGFPFSSPSPSKALLNPRLVTASSALCLSRFLKVPKEHLRLLVCSSFQDHIRHFHLLGLAGNSCENLLKSHFTTESVVKSYLAIQASSLSFFSGKDFEKSDNKKRLDHEASSRNSADGRLWTNVLLTFNVLLYVAQVVTHGRLLLWGAKVNSLIDQGQIWRLATSSFLHADFIHLLVNSYSLNSIGPAVEKICGPKRFLAIYLGSAISSSAMSYRFCQSPAVGASGAIFGLVSSYALFVVRHRRFIGSGKQELLEIFKVIAINMAIGLSVKGIDNWGHLGGLLGGAAISWLVGPLWRYEILPEDGKPIFADKAPIFSLTNKRKTK